MSELPCDTDVMIICFGRSAEDDIIKVMKNLVTKIERERHQAQFQEEGIVWNQLKPVWKEKYWEEMLRGLRDDPNRECEEYEEKQWKEEQDEG